MKLRRPHALTIVLLLSIALVLTVLGWEIFATPAILEARISPTGATIRVTPPGGPAQHYRRGDEVRAHFDYCKHWDLPVHVTAWLEVDNALYEVRPEYQRLPVGCHYAEIGFLSIPTSLSVESTRAGGEGRARIHARHVYQLNAFRTITYDYYSDYFWIDS